MLEQWPIMTLGEVVLDMKDGGTPKRSVPENFGGDINWCVVKDIKPEIFDSKEKLTQQGLDGSSAKLWPEGSIIISLGATIGKIGIARVPTATKQGLSGIVVNEEYILSEFLVYVLHHKVKEIQGLATGTTIKEVRPRKLMSELKLPVPPLEEQKRIVTILDEAFSIIEHNYIQLQTKTADTNDLFSSILYSEFSTNIETWSEYPIGDICQVDWGNTKLTKKSFVEGGEFLAVSAAGCDGRIGHAEHSKFTPVLSAIGARCGRMFFPEEDFTAIKNTITITPNMEYITHKFLYYLLTSVKLPQRGAAQPFISKGDIQKFPVRFPAIPLQKEIVEKLDNIAADYENLRNNFSDGINNLNELKQSILQDAFSGKLTGGITA